MAAAETRAPRSAEWFSRMGLKDPLLANFHRSPSFSAFSLNSVDQHTRRDAAQAVMGLAAEGSLRPVVSERLALDYVEEELGLLRTGVFGKVIVNP